MGPLCTLTTSTVKCEGGTVSFIRRYIWLFKLRTTKFHIFLGALVVASTMMRIWAFPTVYEDEQYDSMNHIYVKPWYRFCSYGVGLILGSILFSMKGKCLGRGMLTKALMMVGWVVSLTTIFLIIYAIDPGHSLAMILLYYYYLVWMIRILCICNIKIAIPYTHNTNFNL